MSCQKRGKAGAAKAFLHGGLGAVERLQLHRHAYSGTRSVVWTLAYYSAARCALRILSRIVKHCISSSYPCHASITSLLQASSHVLLHEVADASGHMRGKANMLRADAARIVCAKPCARARMLVNLPSFAALPLQRPVTSRIRPKQVG